MKLLLDFLPLVFFFATYKVAGWYPDDAATFATHWLGGIVQGGIVGSKVAPVLLATVVVAVATLVQVAWMKLSQRKIGLLLWISLALVIVLGGLTVWFHDETFIKWKPSIALWLMGLVLWGSQTFFGHNLLRETVAAQIELPDTVWQRLNFSYVAYFGLMGLLNLWIAYSFSTDAWANFHTFGSTALWIAFILGQGFYLNKHMEPKQSAEEPLP